MTILNELVVATGSYEQNGETKKRWRCVGHLHSANDGRQYITLDRYELLGLAASVSAGFIESREGDDRVYVNLFEAKGSRGTGSGGGKPAAQRPQKLPDDDVPF